MNTKSNGDMGPDYNEKTSFISKHSNKYGDNSDKIIGMYVQEKSNKVHCDWIQYIEEEGLMKESLLDFLKTVQGAPEGTKFVNWKQPFHNLDDNPDFINIVDEDKWYFTMAKLNDPRMAHCVWWRGLFYSFGTYPIFDMCSFPWIL